MVRFPGKDRDQLLLVFKEAKVSVVEYDPAENDLRTLALNFFENESLRRGRVAFGQPPMLRVDPLSRCAALLCYESKLVVMPFRSKSSNLDDDEDLIHATSKKLRTETGALIRLGAIPDPKTGFLPSYVIDLDDAGYKNVVDFVFLDGYWSDPTVLLLHENVRTWAGRLAVLRNTRQLSALSLNLSLRRHPLIWASSKLPHSCRFLVPVPAPAGGALIVANNALFYRNQGQKVSLRLNGFALAGGETDIKYQALPPGASAVVFDTVPPVQLPGPGYRMLFSLLSGELYVVTLVADARSSAPAGHHRPPSFPQLPCQQ